MENKIEDQTSVQPDQEIEPEKEQLDAEPETEVTAQEPEQPDAEPETVVTPQAQETCPSCGAPMAADQAFCTSCGAAKAAPAKRVCSKCGAELAEGQDFCPNCGQKAGLEIDAGVADAISQFNSGVSAANEAKKKQPQKIIIAVIAAIVVIAAAVFAIPKLFPSVESLCEQGRYVEAYEKADGDEAKLAVKVESVTAQSMKDIEQSLDEKYTYDLKGVYFREGINDDNVEFHWLAIKTEVFEYGSSIGDGYLVYVWYNTDQEWKRWGVVTDLDDETYGYYDSTEEKNKKLMRNVTRMLYSTTVEEGTALSDEGVARVNAIITNGVTIDPVTIPFAANVTEGD